MRIIDKSLFPAYHALVGKQIPAWLEALGSEPGEADLTYLVQASAVYSSNIEGNRVDLNSFMNSIASKTKFKPGKEVDEIKDLVSAYEFAKQHELTEKNFLAAHKTMSRTLLIKDKQGKYRTERMGVFDDTGMVYLAVEPEKVKAEMKLLFEDIGQLLKTTLTAEETFYYASLLHLRLAHIHPFWDGNGRMARLLEKWLLSQTINDSDLPLFVENTTINNAPTLQAKGTWNTGEGSKSGPFICNLMLNSKTNELVLVDGFIIAPGKEKRNYMQELELVLSTASF